MSLIRSHSVHQCILVTQCITWSNILSWNKGNSGINTIEVISQTVWYICLIKPAVIPILVQYKLHWRNWHQYSVYIFTSNLPINHVSAIVMPAKPLHNSDAVSVHFNHFYCMGICDKLSRHLSMLTYIYLNMDEYWLTSPMP